MPPEVFLELGLLASPFVPISLFIFGWTAQAHVHWCVALPRSSSQSSLPSGFLGHTC